MRWCGVHRVGRAAGVLLIASIPTAALRSAEAPVAAVDGDVVVHDVRFEDGTRMADLRLHYETLGAPRRTPAGPSPTR